MVLRKGDSDQAGGHGNDAESCDQHEACENASAKRDGDGIVITVGAHSDDGPPKAVKNGGIDQGLSLILKRVDDHSCEVQNEAEQFTLVINRGKCPV